MSTNHDPHFRIRSAQSSKPDRELVRGVLGPDKEEHSRRQAKVSKMGPHVGDKALQFMRDHKAIATGVAVGSSLLALKTIYQSNGTESLYQTTKPAEQVKFLKQVDKIILNKVVVLKAGSRLHLTPAHEDDGEPGNGRPSNMAGTVAKGKELDVGQPMISSKHPGWVAFTYSPQPEGIAPDANHKDLKSRAAKTVWADVLALEQQDKALEINLPGASPDITIGIRVADNGDIVARNSDPSVFRDDKGNVSLWKPSVYTAAGITQQEGVHNGIG